MPRYRYNAVDLQNKKITAFMDARDEEIVRKELREQELVPLKITQLEDRVSRHKLKARELSDFCRQIAGMLASGITAVRCIEILKKRDGKPHIRTIYERLYKDLQMGNTLSQAMEYQGRAFPELIINMFASGEVSGRLDAVAEKMARHYDKEYRLNSKVKSAMTYPVILFIVTIAVVMFIFTVILPNFFELFEGVEIPAITQVILSISAFMRKFWYLTVIAVLLLVVGFRAILKKPKARLVFDQYILNAPLFGKLLRIIYTGRFARTLSSLYSSGVSMIKALTISSSVVGNSYIQSQFPEVSKNVLNGMPLSDSVGLVEGLDGKLIDMISTGEETGRLDSMLDSVAEVFDYESEMASLRLVQMLEPIMIITVGVIIGVVMISVFLPLFNYAEIAKTF